MSAVPELRPAPPRPPRRRWVHRAGQVRHPLGVYALSRGFYLLVAVADIFIRGDGGLPTELRNWDGSWYVRLAAHGYPHTIPTLPAHWSTLGFEPLYAMLMWLGGVLLPHAGTEAAGLLLSLFCGAVATVEISVLASRWWGPQAGRRGVLFFCFFPGTIVFSMVYTEGLTLALVAGCLLCLEDRRWVCAGLLAGVATAVEPVALAVIPACGAVSLAELHRRGWRDPDARRSLWAPLLSPVGIIGFGVFLWCWTGTPFASYDAQRAAWQETSSPFALADQGVRFIDSFTDWRGWPHVDVDLAVGLLGAVFLAWGLREMWRQRGGTPRLRDGARSASPPAPPPRAGAGVSLGAWIWTVGVTALAVTSANTPPTPRMLICAFPTILAIAAPRVGRSQRILLGVAVALLVGMSIGSFAGGGLRP